MNCKNCNAIVSGNYCQYCGQKTSIGRFTISSVIKDFSESVFQVNNGFFYTVIQLFAHPVEHIKEYLEGKRKKLFRPIAYALLTATVYFLFTQITNQHTWAQDIIEGFVEGATGQRDTGDKNDLDVPHLLIWFCKNYAYISLLLIPVFSMASFLLFKNERYNYAEHIVLNAYTTGQQALLYFIFSMLHAIWPLDVLELAPMYIGSLYIFWVYSRFFKKSSRSMIVARTLFSYVLYLIFCVLILHVSLLLARIF